METYYSGAPATACHIPYTPNAKTLGSIATNKQNFPNSSLPHARSKYLPPNQITAPLTLRPSTLFSTNAAVNNVQGYLMLYVGTMTK
jgi:hypothetical protein